VYNSPVKRQEIFDNTIIQKIHVLNIEYYEALSLVMNHDTHKIQQRLTSKDLSDSIVRLQNIFLESFSTAISAVDVVVCVSGSKNLPTLETLKQDYLNEKIKGTHYKRSTKLWKIRKDLSKKAEIPWEGSQMLKKKLENQLFRLSILLLKKSNLKL
jgi:hypothetical protein